MTSHVICCVGTLREKIHKVTEVALLLPSIVSKRSKNTCILVLQNENKHIRNILRPRKIARKFIPIKVIQYININIIILYIDGAFT